MNVLVTNRNAEGFERRFDGTLYAFPPGVQVAIPEAAAGYLFAYGRTDADRARILVRNGWQRNGLPTSPDGPAAALARLQNFIFNAAPPEPAPAKPVKRIAHSQQVEMAKRALATRAAPLPVVDSEVIEEEDDLEEIETAGNPPSEIPPAGGIVQATEPPPVRVPAGIGAMSPNVDAGGHSLAPRGTISLPGRTAPLAPPANPA